MNINELLKLVVDEMESAKNKHDPFNGPHEGWAVLFEELDELWDEVKANGTKERMQAEAIQVAAMALRFIIDVCWKDEFNQKVDEFVKNQTPVVPEAHPEFLNEDEINYSGCDCSLCVDYSSYDE